VQDLSSYRDDPFRRARTTLGYVLGTTFGNTASATKLIEGVKRIHSRINGTRPDGVAYQALDPELIAWVHTCIPWMIMRTFERYKRPLTPDERDAYLREQAVIGRMGGAEFVPESVAELDDYVAAMRPKLAVNEQTREFFQFLLNNPFVPTVPGHALHHFCLRAGMSIAPEWAQRLTGFHFPAPVRRLSVDPIMRLHAAELRWGFGDEPAWLALASARATAPRMRVAALCWPSCCARPPPVTRLLSPILRASASSTPPSRRAR
jgi:uncharacterized protein (DUF2236 family)